ncbi:MAG: hypothetical protein ACTHM6_16515 [Tepidisphaeraceae bacterium]
MKRYLSLAAPLFLVIGCGPTTQSYSLVVHNDSDEPMTVVLCKDGPPMENYWFPPEDIAMMRHAPADVSINGVAIPPGKTIDQTRQGQFDNGTHAVLRIYRGSKNNLQDLLGIGPDSPNRTDLRLRPGSNEVVIDQNGKASVK